MQDSYNGHKVIIFAQEHYNPLGQIRSLGENGINPIYFSVKRGKEIAVYSKYISKLHCVDTIEEGYDSLLREYGGFDYEHRPYVLFSDDKCIGWFDKHYDELKNKFILFNAGHADRVNYFMNKHNILQIAKKYGFNVLDSVVAKKGEIPKNIQYPIITKGITPIQGGYKSDEIVCKNEKELKNAYSKISSDTILIEKFINKKNQYAIEGISINHGNDILMTAVYTTNYNIPGYYCPYMTVSTFQDKKTYEKLRLLMKEIGYEGIFDIEFLTDANGDIFFMEINFRACAFNYASTVAGMPLSYLWIKSMDMSVIDLNDYKKFNNFMYMQEVIDFGKRVDMGKISLAQWLFEYKQAKTCLYNEKDPEPFNAVINYWEEFK